MVWNMNFIFPHIGNVIIPTDFHSIIFQRDWNHQPVEVLKKIPKTQWILVGRFQWFLLFSSKVLAPALFGKKRTAGQRQWMGCRNHLGVSKDEGYLNHQHQLAFLKEISMFCWVTSHFCRFDIHMIRIFEGWYPYCQSCSRKSQGN